MFNMPTAAALMPGFYEEMIELEYEEEENAENRWLNDQDEEGEEDDSCVRV